VVKCKKVNEAISRKHQLAQQPNFCKGKNSCDMITESPLLEKTREQQETLTLSDISPKWATRLGDQQKQPIPLSNIGIKNTLCFNLVGL
jgi:hypothetical protein